MLECESTEDAEGWCLLDRARKLAFKTSHPLWNKNQADIQAFLPSNTKNRIEYQKKGKILGLSTVRYGVFHKNRLFYFEVSNEQLRLPRAANARALRIFEIHIVSYL